MSVGSKDLPVVVIGAGPVGLAAAAHLADRGLEFVVLESGRVVASGAHAELIEQDGAYRRLYNLQFVA